MVQGHSRSKLQLHGQDKICWSASTSLDSGDVLFLDQVWRLKRRMKMIKIQEAFSFSSSGRRLTAFAGSSADKTGFRKFQHSNCTALQLHRGQIYFTVGTITFCTLERYSLPNWFFLQIPTSELNWLSLVSRTNILSYWDKYILLLRQIHIAIWINTDWRTVFCKFQCEQSISTHLKRSSANLNASSCHSGTRICRSKGII